MATSTRSARARLLATLAGLVVLAALVGGCNAVAQTGVPGDTGAQPATGSVAGEKYVALGDSYTAAPLHPMTRQPNSCLRSGANYPTLVAHDLELDITDVSCSGASTVSMFHPQRFTTASRPPQLDALSADTDVVTLGIGANDYAFFTHMIFDCLKIASTDPTGSPCRSHNETHGRDELERRISGIKARVARVVSAIAVRAPHARILMVGYPQIVPTTGECRNKLPLALGDYAYTQQLNVRLAEAVRNGAVGAGAEYVDVQSASAGHDICSKAPWVAGIRGGTHAMGLHPYPVEQRAVADLIVKML